MRILTDVGQGRSAAHASDDSFRTHSHMARCLGPCDERSECGLNIGEYGHHWCTYQNGDPARQRNVVESSNSRIELLIATTSTWYVRPASTEAVSSIGVDDAR